jgi:hypothetical protein
MELKTENSSQPTMKRFEIRPLSLRSSIGIGVSGPLTYFIVKSIEWKEWDNLLRNSLQSMLERNGPFPAFLAIIIVLMFFSLIGSMIVIVKAKDGEIQRLVEHRDSLESMLGVDHPTSKRKGKPK